jgi:hypothetical protein
VFITLNIFFKYIIKQLDICIIIYSRIIKDFRFIPYFDNYINALNKTYIHAFLDIEQQAPFKNHKGFLSYNILIAYTFDL